MIALLAAAFGVHAAVAQSLQPGPAAADSTRRSSHDAGPAVTAVRVAAPIRVDGMLDDADWMSAAPATEFVQADPREGLPAADGTEVRFLYAAEALSVGARMWDARGVRSRMGRRDSHVEGSDWLYVMLDSHHNHLTAYQFSVNPDGVKRDEMVRPAGPPDDSWDAVWDLATQVDNEGWTAELRIPFSQLRFREGDEQNWGIQIQRRIIRNQELAVLAFTPKRERGGVARFGHLHGLRGLNPGKPLEVMPYAVAQAEFMNVNSADPFRSEREGIGGAGIDLKYRLTSGLTIDGTLNPDFGQVEQDPAVVNLTAFETSFNEKRPFFVEGNDVFGFGENARLFYSRRIGRPPQGAMPGGTRFADRPDASTILAAAKLCGRTYSGWNLGGVD